MKPSELPLEQLALPPHVRHLLDAITEPAPAAPDEVAVVRQPEQEQAPKRKAGLTAAVKAEADRIIRACLKADAENAVKRSGWKVKLAQKLDRHPAWVSNRIRKIQAEDQGVAA